jgi:hypothetical protein
VASTIHRTPARSWPSPPSLPSGLSCDSSSSTPFPRPHRRRPRAWPTRAPYGPTRLRRSAHEAGHRLLADLIEDTGVSGATARVEDGQAPDCLVGIARAENAQFIVVGTHGEGAAHVAAVGSVSLAVARLAACPVVVLPPSVRETPLTAPAVEAVVCGISDPDDVQPVSVAIRLARALELSVRPVHVVPDEDEDTP